MTKQNQNTWLFFAFLLLGGIANLLTRTRISIVDTFMFSANFIIYIGLLIFWMQSVRDRLLPVRSRRYMIVSALLMIFYLLVRLLRYRVLTNVIARRYVDYAYNIPLVLIPTLFLMICILISSGENTEGKRREQLLMIPSCAIVLLVMTNDLHQLCYRRLVPLSEYQGNVGTYTYGPVFYLIYGWMILTLLAGFALLIRKNWRQNIKGLFQFAVIVLVWAGISLLDWLVFTPLDLLRMYHSTETRIFFLIGLFEFCIRNRLIPYNENYSGFFSNLGLPVRITDEAFATVYDTNIPINASDAELFAAVKESVYLDEDTRLSGMKLHPGHVFWTEDERELHEESRRLAFANELLSEENDLIAIENELKERKAHLEAQDRVYDRIASALYPKQKRMEALLESTPPESERFPAVLAECCVLNAYCKRKSNLLLLSEENLPRPNRELFLALQESARFLKCCGIDAAATGEEYSTLPLPMIHALYDSFETLIEALLPVMRRMTVSLSSDGIRIAAETDAVPPLPGTSLPVAFKESDGCLFLTVQAAEGGVGE